MADDEKKPPAALTVTPSTAEIVTGETVQLTASNPQASWSSSNTAIAVVGASGIATGVAPGDAQIKAQYKGEKGEMRITVRNKNDPDNITPPSPADDTYGPVASQTRPSGAVDLNVGDNIPSIVGAAATGTIFWVKAGTHSPTAPINMKSNQQLIGEYGAIIDGTSVTQGFDTASTAIVRGWNATAESVTVQNLVIRNLADHIGIGWAGASTNHWIVTHNEISGCRWGINTGTGNDGAQITHNFIHHNVVTGGGDATGGGGYTVTYGNHVLFEHNEISYNDPGQRLNITDGITFRNNYAHHNHGTGIYYSDDSVNGLIEDNVSEDNAYQGIFVEVNAFATVRNNTTRRNGGSGIMFATTRDSTMSGNVVEDEVRGINLFLDCSITGPRGTPYPGAIDFDLARNTISGNTVRLGASAVDAIDVGYTNCSGANLIPYQDNTKANTFTGNIYQVQTMGTSQWLWFTTFKTFAQWQALPQDATGSVSLR